MGAGPSCRAIVIPDNVRLVVARKNHRADRSQGKLWRLGWLTGRDDDGVHDLVGEGLALGAVPDCEQPAEVAGRAVEQVREQAEERSSRPRWRQATGGRIPRTRPAPSGRYLCLDERLQIAHLQLAGPR